MPVTSPTNGPLKYPAVPVRLPVTLPIKVAVIVPALKFPTESRLTIWFAVFVLVAAFASTVAAPTLAEFCPPTASN